MKRKIYILGRAAMLLSGTLIISCSGDKAEKEAADEGAKKESVEEEENPLQLTNAQMKAVGITLGELEQKNLTSVVKASGQLAVPPQNQAEVSVISGGIMREIYVIEGQQVRKGQVLASLENQELIRIQQEYLGAKNNFTYVDAEYKRQQELRAAGAGTGKSFQSSEATYNAERAKLRAFESQLLQLGVRPSSISSGKIVSRFPILSPISGTVGHITETTGSFIQPGTSLMEVTDNSKIHCDLTVFEKDLMKVKIGQKVNFQLTNQENIAITGVVNGINKSFENESKGVIVHAVINNTAKMNLIPGMYVTALISVGNQLSTALPVEAVVRAEGREYIFAVADTHKEALTFKRVEVKTGTIELGYVQITPVEELQAGTKVITKGAFYLQSKISSGGEEE